MTMLGFTGSAQSDLCCSAFAHIGDQGSAAHGIGQNADHTRHGIGGSPPIGPQRGRVTTSSTAARGGARGGFLGQGSDGFVFRGA